ncbi:MAG: heavy metal translocating P-type ATPase [Halothermotrichaceae bacterium]
MSKTAKTAVLSNNTSDKAKYIFEGLSCSSCAAKIEEAVNDLPEVKEAELNFATSVITVKGKAGQVNSLQKDLQGMADRIEPGLIVKKTGYRKDTGVALDLIGSERDFEGSEGLKEKSSEDNAGNKEESYLKQRFIPGFITFVLALIIFESPLLNIDAPQLSVYLKWTLFGISYILIGGPVLTAAFKNIKRGQIFDENFLMVIATMGAFAIQEFPEAVAVMLFYMVGEMFQKKAVDSSRRSIASLMDIRPDYANLKIGNDTKKVAPDKVQVGDTIIIKPGERVPLDGEVIEGSTMVDSSAITGESVPRKIESGDDILSGMVNKSGLLTVKVNREYSQSTVARILALVENASSKKAATEKFITKFARYYTPAVVYAALAIAVLPPLFMAGAAFSDWFYRALVFLVISCPCALVVSIPLGFFGGIGRASRQGVLVKGGNYLEALNNTNHIVFDKTGTLTEGEFAVSSIEAVGEIDEDELLFKAALAEKHSTHPIAESIVKAVQERKDNKYYNEFDSKQIEDYQEISGHGIKAVIDGQKVLVGNSKLLESENINYSKATADGTIVHVVIDDIYAGHIVIKDSLKADSQSAIRKLKKAGIEKITMLTGDRQTVAESTADSLGIDEYYAELLPQQKVKIVEKLLGKTKKNEKLVFVGDGINDAPVLARADIGVAMGGLGSDAAIEAADIVLMTDEPEKLVTAIDTASKTRQIVWQNIIMALGVKGIVLLLGVLGMANMWGAVFADVGVALLAVLNSMRISRNIFE